MNLIKKFRKLMLGGEDNKVEDIVDLGNDFKKISFSQCGEDMLVDYVFMLRGVNAPSYIDIGAHHPWYINNTAFFYKKGCRGINIEPNPNLIKAFQDERSEDINLNIGVASIDGNMDFYVLDDSALSTFSKKDADDFISKGDKIKEVMKVEVLSVSTIISKYAQGKFPDLMNLDVEGFEMGVLKGIDFMNNYPTIICVETAEYSRTGAGKKRKELMEFIESKGYYLYADTNLNSIYVKNEFWFI
jgi:FkbM family methyltransferase